jgi:hypothetical protein
VNNVSICHECAIEQVDELAKQSAHPRGERALIMCAYYAHIQQIMGPQQFPRVVSHHPFFERERGWYFLSPGGLAVGPYTTERIAESQAVGSRRFSRVSTRDKARTLPSSSLHSETKPSDGSRTLKHDTRQLERSRHFPCPRGPVVPFRKVVCESCRSAIQVVLRPH